MTYKVYLFIVFFFFPLGANVSVADETGLKMVFANGTELFLDQATVIESSVALHSSATIEKPSYEVAFRLTPLAGRTFGKLTKENISKPLKFVLDGRVISAPIVQTSILGGVGLIVTSSESDLIAMLKAMNRYRI